jgi:beta-mannosidase
VWQLDDCWPVLSWSLLDYYGFGKAGYYYLRRAYAPVMASFKALPGGELELWLTNDTLADVHDTATVHLATFDGHTIWKDRRELHVSAGASCSVWRWGPGEVAGGPDRYVSVSSRSGAFGANRHFFTAIKDLARQPGVPAMTVEPSSTHVLRVELRAPADRYVYFAHLTSPSESTQFSDNYIDLEPGETRSVTATDPLREPATGSLSMGWA